MIQPKALVQGDIIGLTAPSGAVENESVVIKAVDGLERLGFHVVTGKSCYERYGYLSGSDTVRANDINDMFRDTNIDGIICIKGGYGASRLLDLLDYDMIRRHPKAFVGYSDLTALHLAFHKKCEMVTYHGPVGMDFAGETDDFTISSFLTTVMDCRSSYQLCNPPGRHLYTLHSGKAEGLLIGGNLSLIAASLGTDYEIDTTGKILFVEDIKEEPYRVDRMLTQLRLSGKLDVCAGIIIGDFNACEPSNPEKSLTLSEVFNDILIPCGKPVIWNLAAGHCVPKLTLPFGCHTMLDANNGCIIVDKARKH